ncbi:DUF3151 domain-containing protein [Actinomycetospora chibensis]|uniref:DUF3151 domain-containing protein n=1 Tax=Actinomycetospora chibensis TaxID=663606 RepID=A0ABV9RDX9_9PSEU|nr:DUF3151 domain-containing protein [Actinomycetospora chibensis]MDD7924057.1 DUF3151 domain-containing protein [Actinomycetospora chibensis]
MTIPTGPGAAHGHNLLGPQPTYLPESPEPASRLAAGEDPAAVVADHPTYSAGWAALAERAEAAGEPVTAYAFARTGYHRGLDQLRRNGWKGFGPVPWDHEPNQGFLRAVAALARAAKAIGETDEVERCVQLVADCDPSAVELLGLAA